MGSRYQKLVRNAWKSGQYKAETGGAEDGGGGDAANLRTLLRSRMEWIVEREAYEFKGAELQPKEKPAMKLAQYVKYREEKFGGVLFETRSEKVFTLSPTGSAIVKEIVAGGTSEEIASRLKDKYQDKNSAIEKEVAEFIGSLKEKGLVTE
ncbi:MAG: PqqD family protein [Elusimicrobiota bacterium]